MSAHLIDTAAMQSMAGSSRKQFTPSVRGGLLMAFVAGFVIMATELLATPLLAPAFGTSLPVWTAVIGTFLIALSIGYALGGRLADKATSLRPLGMAWMIAGGMYALVPLLAQTLFPFVSVRLLFTQQVSVGAVVGTCIVLLLSFVLPTILLSMTSPFLIGWWQRQHPQYPGRVTGRVYACGTVGSVLGVIIGPLVGLPLLGTRLTLVLLAFVVVIGGVLLYFPRGIRRTLTTAAVVGVCFVVSMFVQPVRTDAYVIDQVESYIQYIAITQHDNERRIEVNEGLGTQSSFTPNSAWTDTYVDVFGMLPLISHATAQSDDPARVFLVGLAGGSIPRVLSETLGSGVTTSAVELDPAMDELARTYFQLQDSASLQTTIGDGRHVLRKQIQEMESGDRAQYDYIFIDAFQNETTVPGHLLTREWFKQTERALQPQGVVAMNIVSLQSDS